MKNVIYKFIFTTGVHFGDGSLQGSKIAFSADTLFSALCIEAKKMGDSYLTQLVDAVNNGILRLSDAMPFANERYYIKKPILHIEQKSASESNIMGKKFKNLSYIAVDDIKEYLDGRYDIEKINELSDFGYHYVRDLAAVRQEGDPLPYRIGTYNYNENNGLYIIVSFSDDETGALLEELLIAASLTGIGGKRFSGLGKFDLLKAEMPSDLDAMLNGEHKAYMLLSAGLPGDEEINDVLKQSSFRIVKRSGFVQSDSYAGQQLKKKDCYLMDAG